MSITCRPISTQKQWGMPRVVVCGIGTGGHYFPAIVVAKALQQRAFEVDFVVRRGYLEERVANTFGLKTFLVNARPFYGKPLVGKLLFLFSLIYAVYRLHALTSHATVIAFGGFGAVPLLISSMLNRSMYYMFEPNRVPGRATRRFARRARRVFLGLPSIHGFNGHSLVTGIPVRKEFKEELHMIRHGKKKGAVNVLFYGGSQGARRLNDLAIELQTLIPKRWQITIISGAKDFERVTRQKAAHTRVLSFAEKPWEEIGLADVVISRAGALAGYEILCLNKKVIFIPFPYAIDNHQYYNAQYFAQIGNAVVLEEGNLNAGIIKEHLIELLKRTKHGKVPVARNAEEKIVGCIAGDIANEET